MKHSDGMSFSTLDRDNDLCKACHCGSSLGGWWHNNCGYANLNGFYLDPVKHAKSAGVIWPSWHGWTQSLKEVDMKLRP